MPGGNDINLAALWVPVMPETSKMVPAMRKAGEESRNAFQQGFSGGNNQHAEEMGKQYANQFMRSFNTTFAGLPIPQGMRDFMGSFGREASHTDARLKKLGATAKQSFTDYETHARKAAVAQAEMNRLQEHYNRKVAEGQGAKYHGTLEMIHRQQKLVTDHTNSAAAAQSKYTEATNELAGATGKASTASNLLVGAIGGGVGAAVTLGVSAIGGLTSAYMNLVTSGIGSAIHGFKELSMFTLQAGEDYEHLTHQLSLYTAASGEELEKLNASAARIYGDMDSNADNVGKTMAVLAQRLGMEASPALEKLVYHVEELRGRFGQLDVEQFASGLIAFRVPADQADASLASLVQSAREAGTPINDVITALRTAAPTLEAAGMGYEQAAAFVSELTKRGLEARSMMTGLQTAQGEFSELGLDFSEGMKLAAERMQSLIAAGDEAGAQKVAEELFGTRRWAEAMTMMEAYSDIIGAQPGEFAASADSLDDLIDHTQTLGEKWEEVKRQAQEALRPFGVAAVGVIGTALTNLQTFIESRMRSISEKVRGLGLSFIEQLPEIQQFAGGLIRIIGHSADFVQEQVAITMQGMGMFARLTGMFMSIIPEPRRKMLGIDDFKHSIDDVGRSFMGMAAELHKMDVSTEADKTAEWVEGLNVNVPKLKDNWNDLVGEINSQTFGTPGVGGGIPFGGTANWGMPFGSSSSNGAIDNNFDKPGAAGSGQVKAPGSLPIMGPVPVPRGFTTPATLDEALGQIGQPAPFNAESWRPTVESVVMQMAPAYGLKNPRAWVDALVRQIDTESKGNPNSVNPTDSNGRGGTQQVAGLLNFLGTTYEGSNITGRPYMDPVGQIAAAIELTMRHGLNPDGSPKVIGQGHGFYATGGWVKESPDWADPSNPGYQDPATVGQNPLYDIGGTPHGRMDLFPGSESGWQLGRLAPSSPKYDLGPFGYGKNPFFAMGGPAGTDTIPAWLTPGEFVVNADSAKLFGPLLHYMNGAKYFQGGGSADPDVHGTNPALHHIANEAARFGLEATSGVRDEQGSHHNDGEAIDFSNGSGNTPQMLQFATFMAQNFGTQLAELIYSAPGWTGNINEGGPHQYDAGTLAQHRDHVHVAIRGGSQMNMAIGSGQLPTASMPMSVGPMGMPGSPYGTPGFTGGYGPQDWEAQSRNTEAVREAKQRAEDMDFELGQKRQAITDLEAERAALAGEKDILGRPADNAKEIAALDRRIEEAKRDYTVAERERADQNGEIATAERKLAEGTKAKSNQQQEYEIPGASAFTQLGGGLVKGIAEGFGFGDVFGKAPWEWGIVKLLGGMGKWGLGTANAWADEIGKGHTGMTNFTELPGWEQGGSMGLMNLLGGMAPGLENILPKPVTVNQFGQPVSNQGSFPVSSAGPSVSTGPNVAPATGMPSPYGTFGPPPGPAVVDQSVHVTNNGPKQSDYETWQHAANSQRAPGAMGGLPQP